MAARSLWKGFLRINLVSVPVKAFSATSSAAGEVRLNQLHAECNSRIKYKKTCPIHGEVPNEEIVSGYEYAKDQYVIVDSEEVDKLRTPDEKAIRVDSFVPLEKVEPLYLSGKNYYLLPDGPIGQKAYQVIYQGLVEAGRAAIAHLVMHGKDQYVALRPVDNLLVMAVLNYAEQVTAPAAFEGEIVKAAIDAEELQLIKMLIKSSSKPQLDVSSFKDQYTEKLMQVIEAKVAGKELVAPPAEEPAQVINLMDALRRSVELTQKEGPSAADKGDKAKPPRKMAPSKGKETPARKRKSS
jgi:DNA end-binding protein Ku